jgi:Rieske 2Fe-2S family protein
MVDLARISHLLETRLAGHALPGALYNDPDVFEFDLEAIFGRNWIMVGFEAEVKRPGDWMAIDIGRWPVLITRDRAGELHAYHNTCRHRGARICQPGVGHAARLVCPYHRWTYELSGELAVATRMPEDFEAACHGLGRIHLETLGGVLYVCLGDEPPPIAEFKRVFGPMIAPHGLARAKVASTSTLVEKANWKLVMENARECYHCATSHPELARFFPVGASAHFDYGADRRQEDFAGRMTALGLPSQAIEGDWWQAIRFVLNEGCVSTTMDGRHSVARLMCEQGEGDIGSLRWAVEPNGFAHATADQLFMFVAMPVGPSETVVISKWLVREDAVEGVDYSLDDLTALWTRTNLQDRDLVENNQAGVNSPGFRPGPYSQEAEALTIRFTDWYCAAARAFLNGRLRSGKAPVRAAG